MNPLVSIIIPCYNYGIFINEALDSIYNQTYNNWEIIIIDDGSTDQQTLNFLDSLKTSEKLRVYRIKNGGPSKARNFGIQNSNGEVILPLDADDKIHIDYIKEAINFMEENPSYGIVYCKAKFFGFKSREWKLPEYKFPEILLGNCIFVTSLFYKSDWEKVGGFDESFLDEWEDYDFWLKIISLGRKVYRIPKFYFYYRKGHDSRAKKNEYDQFVLYQKILKNHFELYSNNLEFILEKYLKIRIELNNSKSILNNPIKYIFFIFKRILKDIYELY